MRGIGDDDAMLGDSWVSGSGEVFRLEARTASFC
jgi:hypothetical protein